MPLSLPPLVRTFAALFIALAAGACATPAPVPARTQPTLATIAQPYADEMLRAGSSSVMVCGNAAQHEAAPAAILPQAVQQATANNMQQLQQGLGGGR